MSATSIESPRRRIRVGRRALPYVLSLPALIVCIGILIGVGPQEAERARAAYGTLEEGDAA